RTYFFRPIPRPLVQDLDKFPALNLETLRFSHLFPSALNLQQKLTPLCPEMASDWIDRSLALRKTLSCWSFRDISSVFVMDKDNAIRGLSNPSRFVVKVSQKNESTFSPG